MSRKASRFHEVINQPKTLSQFWVIIPYITNSMILVEKANYPTEDINELSTWHKGEQIFFPAKSKTSGTFDCIITEEAFARNQISIDTIRNIQAGNGSYVIMMDIVLALTYGETRIPIPNTIKILKNSYLLKVQDLPLDYSSPEGIVKWSLTFRYNYIKPVSKLPY